MKPKQRTKVHLIEDLQVSEIACVDFGANSERIDGKRVEHARIALYKRHLEEITNMPATLMEILKGDAACTRVSISAAVDDEAARLVRKRGMSSTEAVNKVWWTPGPNGRTPAEVYDSMPEPIQRQPVRKMIKVTAAEAELDRRARKRMRKTGCDYATAHGQELLADPGLYRQYEKESAAGQTYEVPQPVEYLDPPMLKSAKRKDDPGTVAASDDDECPKCGEDVDEDDNFCSNCGARLPNLKPAA